MTVCNVISTLPIGDNTAVVVEGYRELFKNGIGILNEEGKPFVVLSVGMDVPEELENLSDKTMLLIEGSFVSKTLFV